MASGRASGYYTLENFSYNIGTCNLTSKGGVSLGYDQQSAGCQEGALTKAHAVTSAGSNSYCYDQNGNMRRRTIGGVTYDLSYDAENRLTGVSGATTASFVYDGDGQRVKGTVSGVTTTYLHNYFEWTGSTSSMKKYYYDGATRVAMRTGNSTLPTTGLNWLLNDHLGSTSITADSSGNRTGELRYKGWGEIRFTYGTTPTSYHFTGQRQESSLGGSDGLYYYNARYYDPYLGRFIQADTIIPEIKDPQSLDRYAYVVNNPIRYTDPSGYCTGNAADPNNKDLKCWTLYNKIKESFPNVSIFNPRAWTYSQLKRLQTALNMVRNAFGSQAAFERGMGRFTVAISSSTPNNTPGITIPGQSLIILNRYVFELKEKESLYRIIHEMGHIFDFNGAGLDAGKYKSQAFADRYGEKGCHIGLLGCFQQGQKYYDCRWNIGGACYGYHAVTPLETTDYGASTSIEDFADSFAAYVMDVNNMHYIYVSPDRWQLIENLINQYK